MKKKLIPMSSFILFATAIMKGLLDVSVTFDTIFKNSPSVFGTIMQLSIINPFSNVKPPDFLLIPHN